MPGASGEGGFRLVSINTWKGDGPYRARLDALVEGLRDLQPDVVACQEALASLDGRLSTPRALGDALGMRVAYYATRQKVRDVEGEPVKTWSGLATLTRLPVLDVVARPFPSDPADGDRGALLCLLDTTIGMAWIANTHLTHLRDPELRLRQVQALAADPSLCRAADLRVVCGDLNAAPDSAEVQWLLRGEHGWDALDCFGHLAPAERVTMTARNPHVHARRPNTGSDEGRSIDHVLLLAPAGAPHPRVAEARVVLDRAASNGVVPSDHYGVSVTLEA